MYNDFIVKVYRYWEDNNDSRSWDGWYYSKVYAIDGNEFLVYDNGDMSAYNGEEDFCETGFNWVDFTATMDICGENGRQPIVEPLVPFDIVEFMADRKTESNSEKPNNCERITEDGATCARYPACDDCHSNPLNKVKGSERLVKGTEQTEPQYSEDDMYWISLAEDVANGKMSDAGANQAWLEYINRKTEPSGYNLLPVEDEPTISKMEQVETMSCAECKHRPIGAEICEEPCHYEPQTDWHYNEQDATWYPYKHEDESQTERSSE